jgi:hypothetical protein
VYGAFPSGFLPAPLRLPHRRGYKAGLFASRRKARLDYRQSVRRGCAQPCAWPRADRDGQSPAIVRCISVGFLIADTKKAVAGYMKTITKADQHQSARRPFYRGAPKLENICVGSRPRTVRGQEVNESLSVGSFPRGVDGRTELTALVVPKLCSWILTRVGATGEEVHLSLSSVWIAAGSKDTFLALKN